MDFLTILLFGAGLGLLLWGAELLVKAASRLAKAVGVSPLVIGLTVVAYGTSAPELAVSLQSGLTSRTDIALGNIIGSNIFNILFILGLSAMITPMVVSRQLVRLEVPLMIGVSLVFFLFCLDGRLSTLEGGLLFLGMIGYSAFALIQSRREYNGRRGASSGDEGRENPGKVKRAVVQLLLVVVGLGLLTLGSHWLIEGAVVIARYFGLSELIIGLTVIAVGTSLPEIATSVVAALKGERDIAVGNVVGSNIFNILLVAGLASFLLPGGMNVPTGALYLDMPVMIAVAVACLPIFFTNHTIARWEGGLFFACYVLYTTYLILHATDHDALPAFSLGMVTFVLPLTAVTLVLLLVRAVRQMRRQRSTAAGDASHAGRDLRRSPGPGVSPDKREQSAK